MFIIIISLFILLLLFNIGFYFIGYSHSEDIGCRIFDNLLVLLGYFKVVLLFWFVNLPLGLLVSIKMSLDAPIITGNVIDVYVRGAIAVPMNGIMHAVHLGPVISLAAVFIALIVLAVGII